ncbi:nitrogen permease regulator of amino acid transport activity 3-domain-containing protein [Dendryphion nanum]|uniref:Nitrogen permease regulator 3 n=1 Tax=Dendryphion nanum TaxID=256645 RepID=A0A9P9IAL3_9PLEO|nr:nitrogen permease regulator of amino acid transport activity 3-domain-containing protein [Dendryphion nanum]
MALPLPPASHLQAILLVTKSRSLGPRLVFHYPPLSPSAAALAANKAPAWFGNETSTASVDSHSSDSDWDSGTENGDDDIEVGSRTSGGKGSGRTGATSHRERDKHRPGGVWGRQENIDEEDAGGDENRNGKKDANGKELGGDHDWNSVLGFKVDALEKMLCPSKAFNKRRFELGVESIVFVGAPMFVRDDGQWKRRRKKKEKRTKEEKLKDGDLLEHLKSKESEDDTETDKQDKSRPSIKRNESFIYPQGFEPGYGHDLESETPSIAPSEAGSDTRSNSTTGNTPDMTMFNVVFVLNPPALEYPLRVKEMYDNVTRKYAKALKYEEARFQYVWKEAKKIISIKQQAQEQGKSITGTWRDIITKSLLAKSVAILFEAISNDKIAHIQFDPSFSTSFQIPQADSTPFLPSALEPQMPGLWLTTSNLVIEDDDAPMTQHAALLLLDDPETLIKDLEGDVKSNASPLAYYIRNIIPTKSLQKISMKHNILAQDMEYIASHLVYWRRARLIAPLHPQDTYIVSPNADLSNLTAAIPAYAIRFPTFPSLPKIMSMLSSQPRQFRSFIPTSEHREAYMEILAWLMRGGWVTQLRTFAWVRVTASIKAAVAADIERESQLKKAEEAHRRDISDNDSLTESLFSDKRSSFLSAGRPSTPLRRLGATTSRRDRDTDDEASDPTILSPRTAYRGSPARPSSDAGSTTSTRTTIALPSTTSAPLPPMPSDLSTKPSRPSPLHLKTHSPTPAYPFSPTSPSLIPAPPSPLSPHTHSLPSSPQTQHTASLVLSPQKANSLEARWLEKIGQGFADEELRAQWPVILRYLDGRHALEDIAPREGWKRKKVWGLVGEVRKGGWLLEVRHW